MTANFMKRSAASLSCEPLYTPPEEILYYGSEEDDPPEVRRTKRRRRESIGRQCLHGKSWFMLSASLRGPFDDGWVNPWDRDLGATYTRKPAQKHKVIEDSTEKTTGPAEKRPDPSERKPGPTEKTPGSTEKTPIEHLQHTSIKSPPLPHKIFTAGTAENPMIPELRPWSPPEFEYRYATRDVSSSPSTSSSRPSLSERIEAARKAAEEECKKYNATREFLESISPAQDEVAFRERFKAAEEKFAADVDYLSARRARESLNSTSSGQGAFRLRLAAAKREAHARIRCQSASRRLSSLSSSASSSQRSVSEKADVVGKEVWKQLNESYARKQLECVQAMNLANDPDLYYQPEAQTEAQVVSGGPGMTGIGPSGPSTNLVSSSGVSLPSFSIAPNGTLTEVYQQDAQQRSAQYLEPEKWDLDAAIEEAGTFLGSWDVEAEARKEGEAFKARLAADVMVKAEQINQLSM